MENEKVYRSMNRTGVTNIVIGIIITLGSIAAGVLLIAGGAKLLKQKSSILF